MSEEIPHLHHWKSQLTELKDQLLNKEISAETYQKLAQPLAKKIREAEGR